MKKAELVTIKVTKKAVTNFNIASKKVNLKQYEIVEEASEDVLKKISSKIKKNSVG